IRVIKDLDFFLAHIAVGQSLPAETVVRHQHGAAEAHRRSCRTRLRKTIMKLAGKAKHDRSRTIAAAEQTAYGSAQARDGSAARKPLLFDKQNLRPAAPGPHGGSQSSGARAHYTHIRLAEDRHRLSRNFEKLFRHWDHTSQYSIGIDVPARIIP